MSNSCKTNKKQTITIIIVITISSLITLFFTDTITKNENLLMILTTLFSIFCGFIFLILPLIGQLSLPIAKENEDNSYINEYNNLIDLFWYKLIFYAYLINIILIFIFLMEYEYVNVILKYVIILFSSILIGVSFFLPGALTNLTKKVIERKKQELE